jgi:hypothetical protein
MRPPSKSIGPLVEEVLSRLVVRGRVVPAEAVAAWTAAIGAALAPRTRVVGMRGGELEVLVDSPTLRHELENFRREELLGRVRSHPGGARVRGLRLRVGALPRTALERGDGRS